MCSRANEDSILAVQIFDQKKFKKKDQGFLGVVNVRVGGVIDLDAGGDGTLDDRDQTEADIPRNDYTRPEEIQRQSGRQRQAHP